MDNFNTVIDVVEKTFENLDNDDKISAFNNLQQLLKRLELSLKKGGDDSDNATSHEDSGTTTIWFRTPESDSVRTPDSVDDLEDTDTRRREQDSLLHSTRLRRKIHCKSNDFLEGTIGQPDTSSDLTSARNSQWLVHVDEIKCEAKNKERSSLSVRRGNRKRRITAKLLESVPEGKDTHSDTEESSDVLTELARDMPSSDNDSINDKSITVMDTNVSETTNGAKEKRIPRRQRSVTNQTAFQPPKEKIAKSTQFFNRNNIKRKYTKRPDVFKTCSACNETFQGRAKFRRHLARHGDVPVCCKQCRREFLNPVSLYHHTCRYTVAENRTGPKVCRVCGEEFETVRDLHSHMRADHNLKSREPSFFCKFCGRGFVKKVSMYSHYKEHAKINQMVCFKCGTFCDSFEKFSNHMEEHTKDANYKCEKCSATFTNLRNYQVHMTGHEKYKCSECDQSYASRKRLELHCRDAHGTKIKWETKVFECNYCHRKFGRPGQMEVHLRIHTGERPIECSVCNMFFRTSKALFKHRNTRTHLTKSGQSTKDKTFLCNECGRSYYRKQALQRHMKYHMDDDKPHICSHCGYRCRESNNLKRHISLHFVGERNFVCEVCGSSFHAKKTLEMHHSYKHSSERKFTCKLCPLSFKAANALNRHMKTHSDVKDQKCWCGTSFKRRYNLRRHMRQVHGTDEALPPARRLKILDEDNKQANVRESCSMDPEARQSEACQADADAHLLINTEGNQMTQDELFSDAAYRKAIQTAVSSSPASHTDSTEGAPVLQQMNCGIQDILLQHIHVPADMSVKQLADQPKHFTQLAPVSKDTAQQPGEKDSMLRYYGGQQQSPLPICRDHCYYIGPDSNAVYSGGLLPEETRSPCASVIIAPREVTSTEEDLPTSSPAVGTVVLSHSGEPAPHISIHNATVQQISSFYVGLLPQPQGYSVGSPAGMKLENIAPRTVSESRLEVANVPTDRDGSPPTDDQDHMHLTKT